MTATPEKIESDHLVITRMEGADIYYTKNRRLGTWSVSFARGKVAGSLEGEWLSLPLLKQKVAYFLANREKNKVKGKV